MQEETKTKFLSTQIHIPMNNTFKILISNNKNIVFSKMYMNSLLPQKTSPTES